jgi:putative salt-induced outer membrane protein YdiY
MATWDRILANTPVFKIKNIRMKKLITLLLLFCTYAVYSQSIVNTEKALPTADKNFAMTTDFTTSSNYGNLDIFRLSAGLSLGTRLDSNNIFRVISGLTMLHTNGNIVKNIGYTQVRNNFVVDDNWEVAVFYQAQYNANLIMNSRQLAGSGFSYKLQRTDSSNFSCKFFIGTMVEWERLNPEKIAADEIANTFFHRTATNMVLRWDIKNVHIVSITYYQMNFEDFRDYRMLNDTELQIDVNKKLALNFMFQYRYDSKPPSVLTPHDFMNSIGLTYKY